MDEKSTSRDASQKTEKLPLNSTTQEDTPQLFKWWDRLWGKLQNLGMADIAMRAGSALVTIGLVGLIIWLMKDFFISGEMASTNVEAFELAAGGEGGVELPSYSGVGEVEGLSRSVEAHKEGEVTSRYEFSRI